MADSSTGALQKYTGERWFRTVTQQEKFTFSFFDTYSQGLKKGTGGTTAMSTLREINCSTILFADIVQSTQMYETLGDKGAQNLITACLSALSEVTRECHGTVVKTIGDEVMCTFSSANDAIRAAKTMHESLDHMPAVGNSDIGPPRVRVGAHRGSVVSVGEDLFGSAVIVAARMVTLAKQRQTLITEQTVEALAPEYRTLVRYIDKTVVKGKKGELKIYEVISDQDEVTISSGVEKPPDPPTVHSHLTLQFRGQTIEAGKSRPSVTMGRYNQNDVTMKNHRVSRSHARIDYRKGRFVLTDQSLNGTFVHTHEGKGVYLKRDEVVLQGKGFISLGGKVECNSPGAIHFAVEL